MGQGFIIDCSSIRVNVSFSCAIRFHIEVRDVSGFSNELHKFQNNYNYVHIRYVHIL